MKEKIELLESINLLDDLSKVIDSLLNKMGLEDVFRGESGIISASLKTPLKKQKVCFILSIEKLQGKNSNVESTLLSLSPEDWDTIYIVSSKTASSNQNVSNYFKNIVKQKYPNIRIEFWSRNEIIENIDSYYEDFWKHSDVFLQPYENFFLQNIKNDFELRSLLKLEEKYLTMLDIFIEPRLSVLVEDIEAKRPIRKSIKREKLINAGSYILSGDAGTGKSTLLKAIGKTLVEMNQTNDLKKNLPIYIKQVDFIDNNFNLDEVISSILLKIYQKFDIERIFDDYNIVLLIDSIDELDKSNQKSIMEDIHNLCKTKHIRYSIATRSYDYLIEGCDVESPTHVIIENFNVKQIQAFLHNFFRFDEIKADKLIDSLRNNKILEKLPITPLTLSVISILYEERQYEIPATITDVYDNFNLFLLGRNTVKSKLEFLDINIKERIISYYALVILRSPTRKYNSYQEFVELIEDFFKNRSITINKEMIPELVNSLTQGTGVLFVDENKHIQFKHNFFMEYYASLEIFKQNRGLESELVERFTEFNWQNTAIFYAGRTKDMPDFLSQVIERIKKSKNLVENFIAVSGMGYLLQALWLTDANLRKRGILESLNLVVKSVETMNKLAYEKYYFFEGLQYPVIALINSVLFFKDFDSITLKDPLILAFDELLHELENNTINDNSTEETLMYKLYNIGLTLYSSRIGIDSKLDVLFSKTAILNNPLFLMLFDKGLDLIDPKRAAVLKKDKQFETKKLKYNEGINFYINNSAEKLRFTKFDAISSYKRVELFTEGKTDSEIIKHAHDVLTNNALSYWNIKSCGSVKEGVGGADELKKMIESMAPTIENEFNNDKIFIGIFDNDLAGNRCWGGLKKDLFIEVNNRVKKHKEFNIYAIKLPIPESKSVYIKDKDEFKFFEIEHYFPEDFLRENNMLKKVNDFDGIFEITGKKADFARKIRTNTDRELFSDFRYLFDEIDYLSNEKTNYNE